MILFLKSIIAFLITFPIYEVWSIQCIQRNPCKCVDETGYGYDLHALGESTTYLATQRMANNLTFYYHPCKDITVIPEFTNATDNCKSYSVSTKKNIFNTSI